MGAVLGMHSRERQAWMHGYWQRGNSMKWTTIKKNKRSLIKSLVVGLLIFAAMEVLAAIAINNMSNQRRNDLIGDYIAIQEGFGDLITDYTSLLKGVGAYIQMNDAMDDAAINRLLELLIGDRQDEFISAGILKDTTITWVYPYQGNETALGIDLSKVEGQAQDIAYVKENLTQLVIGPVDLVQGGSGFIIRIPIIKNDAYWGMTSFVLKTQVVMDYFDKRQETHSVKLLVRYKDQEKKIIYGDAEILDDQPLVYESKSAIQKWQIYLVPAEGWLSKVKYFIGASLVSAAISLYIAWRLFKVASRLDNLEEHKQEMIAKSTRDAFTGIFNRGYFDIKAHEEINHADRFQTPLTMIYFDIDRFKSINDTYGHAKGDQVLLEVTSAVTQLIRTNDFFARWGGDEFVVLLPSTGLEGGLEVAQKIKTSLNGLSFHEPIHLSASIGLASRVGHEFYESWFSRVDKALYAAKASGRDCISISNLEDHPAKLRIVWQRRWNCGQQIIDDQHQQMVVYANEVVQSAFDRANYDETLRKANRLLKKVERHFIDEILYLQAINFPNLLDHKALHERILLEMNDLYKGLVNKTLDSSDLLTYLNDELIYKHFVRTDDQYRQFIGHL